jgi:uncharacterized protein
MTKLLKKQFIAGAICPQCNLQDTIILFRGDNEHITCCRCDFVQNKSDITTKQAVENVPISEEAKR